MVARLAPAAFGRYALRVSQDFRFYLSGDTFPEAEWQFVMDVVDGRVLRDSPTSPWYKQWMTASRVWVTVSALANTRILRPPWAQWCVTLDFSAKEFEQSFDATSTIALALVVLPRDIPGIRVQATDAFDDAEADTIAEWATIAERYLSAESVATIVDWALSA